MTQRNKEDEEAQLFLDAVKDVKRMEHRLAGVGSRRIDAPAPRQVEAEPISDEGTFLRDGVQMGVLRKLRRGHIPVEEQLDLHGCSSAEAEVELQAFIRTARRPDRQRAVRIIHGKGLGVLKEKTRDWLRQQEGVLAFCPAGADAGGTGAVHVLLRKL